MKAVECPKCFEKVRVIGKNPIECQCGAQFNVVTRTVAIRIDADQAKAEKVLETFHQVGQWVMEKLRERSRQWQIIPKEEGKCANCGEKKNLTIVREEKKYCSTCGRNFLWGSEGRKVLLPLAKAEFKQIPRLTLIDLAFRRAQSLFQRWFADNWKRRIKSSAIENQFKECKSKGKKEIRGEASEITQIRESWRQSRGPISPFRFFYFYQLGRDISKSHRRERRERLAGLGLPKMVVKEIEEIEVIKSRRKRRKKIPLTEIAYALARPICRECENLERYEWGFECELDQKWTAQKPTKFPEFPQTVAQFPKESYQIKKGEVALPSWEPRGEREKARIHLSEWLETYRYQEFKTTPSPYLYRPREKEGEYYFMYPLTEVVEIKPGEWNHLVAYGPTTTCVLTLNEKQEKVKFFRHGEIVSDKEYFRVQRRKAKNGFFEKPRLKERSKIHLILHQETKEIVQFLRNFPGQVTLINMKKKKFGLEVTKRKELNRRLANWADSLFRARMGYKLELAGFIVEEKEFDVSQLAICPYCKRELGKSWLDLIIVNNKSNADCQCGKSFNLLLGIAKAVKTR